MNATGTPYTAIQFEFPDELVAQPVEPSPEGWREKLETTRPMGSVWLKGGSGLVLAVPSAIIPVEFNYLLNPLYPSLLAVRAVQGLDFRWDRRLF